MGLVGYGTLFEPVELLMNRPNSFALFVLVAGSILKFQSFWGGLFPRQRAVLKVSGPRERVVYRCVVWCNSVTSLDFSITGRKARENHTAAFSLVRRRQQQAPSPKAEDISPSRAPLVTGCASRMNKNVGCEIFFLIIWEQVPHAK